MSAARAGASTVPARESLWLDAVPMALSWKDPGSNLERMRGEIRARLAARPEVAARDRLFVFPELTLTGFVTADPMSCALSRDSDEVRAIGELARERGVGILAGFPELVAGQAKPTNTILGFGHDGKLFADYQKIHLFTAGSPLESETYQAGTQGTVASYRGWKIGIGICFDLRFPELFQAYASAGADVIILPACWTGGPTKADQFKALSAGHAVATQTYFMSVNRAGRDPNWSFEGEAFLCGPRGQFWEGSGLHRLDPSLIEDAKKLPVRPSRRASYPVR